MKITVKLLKGTVSIEDSLKDDHGLKKAVWNPDKKITLYYEEKQSPDSDWKKYINRGTMPNVFKKSGIVASALLFVPVDKRLLVITFGFGFAKLKDNSYVKDFGLKVVLNSVKHDTIRSIDIKTHDEITINKRVQTSKKSEINVFGVDKERDMLKEVTGTPIDKNFAKELTGKHSLTIVCDLNLSDIRSKCANIYAAYTAGGYEEHFKWIDNIRAIEDKDTINTLDSVLVTDIVNSMKNQSAPDFHLASPDIIDYSTFGTLSYKGFGSKNFFDSLDILDYIAELKKKKIHLTDINTIKKHKIVETKDGVSHDRWSIYDCIVYETELRLEKYVLTDGQWYNIDNDFVKKIESYISKIYTTKVLLSDGYKNDNEEKYNQRLEKNIEDKKNDKLIPFDTDLIKLNSWNYGIEACDFFSTDLQFIHIKDEATSSKLSHLFNQGVVSAEVYLRESEFRKEFKNKAKIKNSRYSNLLPRPNLKLERDKFEVVFAVLKKPNRKGNCKLPFFSKVTLRNTARKLEDFGYKVSFTWIKKIL